MLSNTSESKSKVVQHRSVAGTHTTAGVSLPAVPVLQQKEGEEPLQECVVHQLVGYESWKEIAEPTSGIVITPNGPMYTITKLWVEMHTEQTMSRFTKTGRIKFQLYGSFSIDTNSVIDYYDRRTNRGHSTQMKVVNSRSSGIICEPV